MKRDRLSNCSKQENLPDKLVMVEALKKSLNSVNNPGWVPEKHEDDQSGVTSLLIHDLFGGEILKTHIINGWHYYNMIDGERIDLATAVTGKEVEEGFFEDIPSNPDEPSGYLEKDDYVNFFNMFIRAFEETVGLIRYRRVLTAE
jgi:hypothetical protein